MDYTKREAKDAAKEAFRGIWGTVHTPMTPDGELDEAGLRTNIDKMITDWRLSGLLFNGAVGEFWALTREEQHRVIEIGVEETRGRCKNIVMTTATSVQECIALTRFAQEVGADFAAPFNPVFPAVAPEEGLARWWTQLAESVDIGLWMIDTGLAGANLSLKMTAEMAALPNIVGLKVQRGAEYYDAVRKATGGALTISDAHEGSLLERVRQGQEVYMSAPAAVLMQRPGYTPMVDYFDAARRGDWDEAQRTFDSMTPLRELYETYLSAEKFKGTIAVAVVKPWSAHLGLAAGPVRPPLVELSPAETQELLGRVDALSPQGSAA